MLWLGAEKGMTDGGVARGRNECTYVCPYIFIIVALVASSVMYAPIYTVNPGSTEKKRKVSFILTTSLRLGRTFAFSAFFAAQLGAQSGCISLSMMARLISR